MNNIIFSNSILRKFAGGAAGLFFLLMAAGSGAADLPPGGAQEYQPAPDEFSGLGQAVVDLLRRGATARFATGLAASAEDWKSVKATNSAATDEELGKRAAYDRSKIESSARAVLQRAEALNLDFTTNEWRARVILPRPFGNVRFTEMLGGNVLLPQTAEVEIVLEPGAGAGSSTNGDFKLAARGMVKFPGGWRSTEGIRWEAFPNNVGDDKTRRALVIWDKVDAGQAISAEDDPPLRKLGETMVRFIREGDPAIFEKNIYITADLLWPMIEKSGRGGSRADLEKELNSRAKEQIEFARGALQQMEESGIDLKNADIQIREAAVERVQARGLAGSLAGAMGRHFELKLAVKSEGKAKNGASLTGDYVLAADEVMRFEDEWRVMNHLHWQELPDRVLGPETVARMKFDNYIAEHGTLPPETAAPEIEFVTLAGGKKMKLSDLRGKVVVLDFWATWCGPCQGPMAELQKIRDTHPDWKDRVAIMPLSIDDAMDTVRQHVDKRGWTNTFNVWADEGGWQAKPVKAFHVNGVPTTYIIDAKGKIVKAGHPAALPIGDIVDGLVKE